LDTAADIKALKVQVNELKAEVEKLKDLEAINRLQKTYGYYLEHWMYEDIIELFSDSPATLLNLTLGIFHGKKGIIKYFSGMNEMTQLPEFLHQIMQLAGVVDIAKDGKTAKGRWYGFGAVVMPRRNGYFQDLASGIYTCEYIKENGTWKILKLMWNPIYDGSGLNLIKDKPSVAMSRENSLVTHPLKFDEPRNIHTNYPTGYIVPFHYNHPVTGKPCSASRRNASRKKQA
jgi:hypothetical protein